MNRPFKQGDRVRTPSGWGLITGYFNNDPSRFGWWEVTMESGFGRVLALPPSQIQHERFVDFCTRPTGFGKTRWGRFWLEQAFVMVFVVAGIATWNEGGWTAIVAMVVVEAVIVLGAYKNYTREWV